MTECPTCGWAVRIVSSDEGTSHYEAAALAAVPTEPLDLPRCVVEHAHGTDEGQCVYETDEEYDARLRTLAALAKRKEAER